MAQARRAGYFLLLTLPLLCNGCAGKYFRDAGKPPAPPQQFVLSDWPYKEYWAESMVNDHWVAVDPTFRQMPADATHIKFIEGENLSDLLPLVDLIGKIKLRIIEIENP